MAHSDKEAAMARNLKERTGRSLEAWLDLCAAEAPAAPGVGLDPEAPISREDLLCEVLTESERPGQACEAQGLHGAEIAGAGEGDESIFRLLTLLPLQGFHWVQCVADRALLSAGLDLVEEESVRPAGHVPAVRMASAAACPEAHEFVAQVLAAVSCLPPATTRATPATVTNSQPAFRASQSPSTAARRSKRFGAFRTNTPHSRHRKRLQPGP